jgi:hypothetical protein
MTIDAHGDLLVGQTIGRVEDQPRPLHIRNGSVGVCARRSSSARSSAVNSIG